MAGYLKPHSTLAHVLYGMLIVLVIVLSAFAVISYLVWEEIDSVCAKALKEYPGDKVEALIKYLDTGELKYRERHRVVWTLGELRDKRALPTLKSLLKNKRYDRYEVKKAVKKITGEILNPFFWKNL